jgi:hypothetical protein
MYVSSRESCDNANEKRSCPCPELDVWGSGCIDPHFLDLGTNWRWVVSFTPLPLKRWGKRPRYPLDRRLDGPWTTWRRENSWPYRDSNPDPSVVQPVASRCTDWAIPASAWTLCRWFIYRALPVILELPYPGCSSCSLLPIRNWHSSIMFTHHIHRFTCNSCWNLEIQKWILRC